MRKVILWIAGGVIGVFLAIRLGLAALLGQMLWQDFTAWMYRAYLPKACGLTVGAEADEKDSQKSIQIQTLGVGSKLLEQEKEQDAPQLPETCAEEHEEILLPEEESYELPGPLPLFVPGDKKVQTDYGALADYEQLVKEYFTIDSTTTAGGGLLNTQTFLEKDLTVAKDASLPQILIYHTHSREGYADSDPDNIYTGVVGAGEKLAQILREDYGYNVIHHVEVFDKPDFTKAYTNALPVITSVLEENPSVEVVIDLHRDDLPETYEYTKEIQGMKCARFMFFNGLSRTKKNGELSYLKNDNLAGNLAFSFAMQTKAREYYPGLTRKIYLKGYRYNMHLKEKTLLLELGCQHNTFEEACNSCYPLAHILDMVLSGNLYN